MRRSATAHYALLALFFALLGAFATPLSSSNCQGCLCDVSAHEDELPCEDLDPNEDEHCPPQCARCACVLRSVLFSVEELVTPAPLLPETPPAPLPYYDARLLLGQQSAIFHPPRIA